jgi:hypothetical protein
MTTLPLTFPPLVAEAERLARESHDARRSAVRDRLGPLVAGMGIPTFDRMEPEIRQSHIDAQARLLGDPTRRDSQAWMAEWIGRRIGKAPWAILALLETRPEELMRMCLPPAQVATGLDVRDILVACVLALHDREAAMAPG